MRHGNASWINETRKKAKCNKCRFWMTLVYFLGLKVAFNVHLYCYSMFDFGLETELDLYSSVAKFGKFEILDMRPVKTQFDKSICSF